MAVADASGPPASSPATQHEVDPAELVSAVEQLFELLGSLRGQVEALADAVGPAGTRKVILWPALDAAAARETWFELREWVLWLLDRYAVKEVPRGCWWRHGMLVEELTALWLAWQAAYGEKADATAPLIWLEHFDRARDRIRQRLQQQGACGSGHHNDPAPQPAADGEDAEFDKFVESDVRSRVAGGGGPANGVA